MNRIAAPAAAIVALALIQVGAASGVDAAEWNFDVYLDDREIGFHSFELDEVDGARVLLSEADFRVKFLFLTAFSYEHDNREVWRDGCLTSIEARTNANGKRFNVRGAAEDGRFMLESDQGPAPVDDCVGTFAYWDRELLERDRLLNAQTGEYLEVRLEPKPNTTYAVGERDIDAELVHVTAKGVDIVLTYASATGEWLALESTLKNGRTLSYRRSAADLQSAGRVALTE